MNKFTRLTALLLALIMILSTFAAAEAYPVDGMTQDAWSQIVQNAQEQLFTVEQGGDVITQPGNPPAQSGPYTATTEICLSAGEAEMTSADQVIVISDKAAQWQIAIGETENEKGETVYLWANIGGETGTTLSVNYAMLSKALPVVRQVEYDADNQLVEIGRMTFTLKEPVAFMSLDLEAREGETAGESTEPLSLERANEGQMIIIEVCYQIDGTKQGVATSYVAQIGLGSKLDPTLILPRTEGYLATEYKVEPEAELVGSFTAQTKTNDGSITLDVGSDESVQNYTITVLYTPTVVPYVVNHHQQNPDNDDHTLVDTDNLEGKTGTAVGSDLYKKYAGFEGLWYDSNTKIAADGSTVVEIYYDREYFLMSFDLGEGGYGVDPIYARYGASISVGKPERPGYEFLGWSETPVAEQTNPQTPPTFTQAEIPGTMPNAETTYYAVWDMVDTSSVSIVFMGQDPNPDANGKYSYSYLGTGVVEGVTTGSEYTYNNQQTTFITCGQQEHEHTAECVPTIGCGIEEHPHDASCCTVSTTHTHTRSCYDNVDENPQNNTNGYPQNVADGYIYQTGNRKYIYISGQWYRYRGYANSGTTIAPNNNCPGTHTHGDGNCDCDKEAHSHTSTCYTYSCGLTVHNHTNACRQTGSGLDTNLWTLVTEGQNYTAEVKADGSTVIMVYYDRTEFTIDFYDGNTNVYTIKEKWGADLSDHWPIVNKNTNYKYETERWDVRNNSTNLYNQVLVYIAIMPQESFQLEKNTSTNDQKTMRYYVEALPNTEPYDATYTYNNVTKNFDLDFTITPNYGFFTESEDFFDLEGFTKWTSNPRYSGGEVRSYDSISHYYTRNTYNIEFRDFLNKDYVHKTVTGVPYEQQLSVVMDADGNRIKDYTLTKADIIPGQDPEAWTFAGWYLEPECSGEEYVIAEHTMPVGAEGNNTTSLVLYAKWVSSTHTVNYYLTKDALDKGEAPLHTESVTHGGQTTYEAEPTNGGYTFDGWFYTDEAGNEYKFSDSQPINRDMNVYGKWSADDPVGFTIYFKDKQGNDVATPYQGEALPGKTVTFDAYVDEDLDMLPDGVDPLTYIPHVSSHSFVVSFTESENVFTFEYATDRTVKYTVQYLEAEVTTTEDGKQIWTPKEGADPLVAEVTKETTKAVVTENYVPVTGYMPKSTQERLAVSADEEKNIIQFLYVKNETNAPYNVSHYKVDYAGAESLYREELNKSGTIKEVYYEPIFTDITGYRFDHAVVEVPKQLADGTWDVDTYPLELVTGADGVQQVGYPLPNVGMHIKVYYKPVDYPYIVYHVDEDGNKLADPDTYTAPYGSTIYADNFDKTIQNYVVDSMRPASMEIKVEDLTAGATLVHNVIIITYRLDVSTLTIVKTGMTDGESAIVKVEIKEPDATKATTYTIVLNKTNRYTATIADVLINSTYMVTEQNAWTWRYDDTEATSGTIKANGNTVTIQNSGRTDQWLSDESAVENNLGNGNRDELNNQ